MKIVIWFLTISAIVLGILIFVGAKSAIHEIEAFLLFIMASILFSSLAITSAIQKSQSRTNTNPEVKP